MLAEASVPLDLTESQAITAGRYQVRFAKNNQEIALAQALRYRVFYVENQGQPTSAMVRTEREIDPWDEIAYHIIVLDKRDKNKGVGTVRLTSREYLTDELNFYTDQAFDLGALKSKYNNILELSRSCVDADARSGAVLMLIWKFAMKFITERRIELLLGCASFNGANVEKHSQILTYLYDYNCAPEYLMPKPIVKNYVSILDLKRNLPTSDWEKAKRSVPTLLRGYLKLGAKVSDTAIIDPQFNSVFVAIYVDVAKMLSESHTLVPRSS